MQFPCLTEEVETQLILNASYGQSIRTIANRNVYKNSIFSLDRDVSGIKFKKLGTAIYIIARTDTESIL